ncbi:MAG: hypothetical protein WC827_00295 [Candidatus Paceibacterota bacterium]|jgi:hypothetical protein
MKRFLVRSSKENQFWTFLIKKSRNGKMGLWFVMVYVKSLNFITLSPVWRKIENNGLPKNIGTHGRFILGGDIKLLGGDDAGSNEKEYISQTTQSGSVKHTLPCDGFGREKIFRTLLLLSKESSGEQVV